MPRLRGIAGEVRLVRRWPRVLLVLSALVWMLVGMGTKFHHVAVTHVVCPEHGETVDVGGTAEASATPAIAAAPSQSDAHDACGVPSALPGAAGAAREVVVVREHADVAYVSAGAKSARLASPLAYAPKTSPPPLG